jgi:hypothetical protein
MASGIRIGMVLLGVCAAGACASGGQSGASGSEIRLGVEAAAARDSVTLVLTNDSREEVGYNLCPSALERRVGEAWQAVPSNRICTMELRLLPAGRAARHTLGVPAGLAGGSYRYRASVTRMGSNAPVDLTSDVFQVSD